MDYLTHYESPLGDMTIASDGKSLTGLWFDGQKYFASTLYAEHKENDSLPVFDAVRRWLDIYFCGEKPGFTPPLLLRGSQFQQRVWKQLLCIGYGQTTTYGELGRMVTQTHGLTKVCARAVGGAVGHNPISLIIPCHRVVGAGGKLTGYAGGVERKASLLKMETQSFSVEQLSPTNEKIF